MPEIKSVPELSALAPMKATIKKIIGKKGSESKEAQLVEQLVEDVHREFAEYPPEQLEKMWQHKSYVMGAVLETQPQGDGAMKRRPTKGRRLPTVAISNLRPMRRLRPESALCPSVNVQGTKA